MIHNLNCIIYTLIGREHRIEMVAEYSNDFLKDNANF